MITAFIMVYSLAFIWRNLHKHKPRTVKTAQVSPAEIQRQQKAREKAQKDAEREEARLQREEKKAILNNIYLKPKVDNIETYNELLFEFVMQAAGESEDIEMLVIKSVGTDRYNAATKMLGKPYAEFIAIELINYL